MDRNYKVDKSHVVRALLGSWSTLMELGRKGDANKIESLAGDILDSDVFATAIHDMLVGLGIDDEVHRQLAKDGFLRIGYGESGNAVSIDEKRVMAVEYLIDLATALNSTCRAVWAKVPERIGAGLIGEENFEAKLAARDLAN